VLNALTGIRGFAAIWVVLYHQIGPFVQYFGQNEFVAFIYRGYLGVDLFAFVSGFIIAHTYSDKLATLELKPALRFLWLRFARTYPLHLFVLWLFILPAFLERGVEVFSLLPQDPGFMRQLFLLNGLGFEDRFSWNVPSWSLGSEWFCYLVFPLLIPYINRTSSGLKAICFAVLLLLATAAFMHAVGTPHFNAFLDWGVVRIFGEFFTGVFLHRAYVHKALFTRHAGLIGAAFLIAAVYVASQRPVLPTPIIIFCFAAFTYTLAQGRQPLEFLFSNRISVYLGEISYSIYMLHWLVLLNERTVGFDQTPLALRPWLMVGLVILLSALTYELVERPTRRWLRARFKPA
jgi:peptidoglycan/LPS O-acetylase OafA/YrhL